MHYLDLDLEIGPGNGGIFPVQVLRSPAGQASAVTRFPFDDAALRAAQGQLQLALARSGQPDIAAHAQAAQVLGSALFDALFSGEVRRCYEQSLLHARAQSGGLRLHLRVQPPELAAAPWEWLFDAGQHSFLCASGACSLIRTLHDPQPLLPLRVEPPLRLLIMMANPTDQPSLDTQREVARLQEAIHQLDEHGLLKIGWVQGQTWHLLQAALRAEPWHMFHFIGRGSYDLTSGDGLLALTNEAGGTHWLSASMLGRALAGHTTMRLVVLNASGSAAGGQYHAFSSTAAALTALGVPAVLALPYELADRAAIAWTRTLYAALANSLSVGSATAEARTAISLAVPNTLEWGAPALHMRGADGRLFSLSATRSHPLAPPGWEHAQTVQVPPLSHPLAQQPWQPLPTPPQPARSHPLAQPEPPARSHPLAPAPAPAVNPGPPPSYLDPTMQLAAEVPAAPAPAPAAGGAQRATTRRTVLVGLAVTGLALAGGAAAAWYLYKPGRGAAAPTACYRGIYRHHTGQVTGVAWSPDGKRVVSVSDDTTAQVWEALTGRLLTTYRGHTRRLTAVSWSADGTRVATASYDHTVQLWNPTTGQTLRTYQGHTKEVYTVTWSRNSRYIASGGNDSQVHVWDAETGEVLTIYTGHQRVFVTDAEWSPDNFSIASCGADAQMHIWTALTGQNALIYRGHSDTVFAVSWSPDGQRIASAGNDNKVLIWFNGNPISPVSSYYGHTNHVYVVVWSPDGNRVASSSADTTVQVWNPNNASDTASTTYRGHTQAVHAIAWSLDGVHLLSGANDQTAQVWDAQSGTLIAQDAPICPAP